MKDKPSDIHHKFNIFDGLQDLTSLGPEKIDLLLSSGKVRIERIVSKGHCSPENGWYDQDEHEWVIVLNGAGVLLYDDGREHRLNNGDFLLIPKHQKHRVIWTEPQESTIWLAVFWKD